VFGNGDVMESNKIVNLDIYFNDKKFRIEFYVLSGIPVELLVGNKFLGDNKAILDYSERCLRLGNEKLNFEGYDKDSEEVLDEIMIDNVCGYMGSKNLINFLNLYKNENVKMKYFLGKENTVADRLSRFFYLEDKNLPEKVFEERIKNLVSECTNEGEINNHIKKNNRIIIGEKYYKKFLTELHILSGHRGTTTMYNNIKTSYYIKNIIRKINEIVRECRTCGKYKLAGNKRHRVAKMIASEPFNKVSTDIYGPFNLEKFNTSGEGKVRYIISYTDVYSRTTSVKFSYHMTSKDVIKGLMEWIERHKKPQVLISDNGKQFTSMKLKEFLSTNNIQQCLIPSYTPSSNGISERINKTISFILSISENKNMKEVITTIENTLNFNYNRNLRASPFEIINHYNLYDVAKRETKFLYPFKGEKINIIKIGDRCRLKLPLSKKLGPKFSNYKRVIEVSKNGYWVKVRNHKGWIHIKNLKF
ncbi:MAG: DDE-type integrase/transposase/recombinase, partial [Lactobacillaceae bacterium]